MDLHKNTITGLIKAFSKRNILRRDLRLAINLVYLTSEGKEFHKMGALMEKDLSLLVVW